MMLNIPIYKFEAFSFDEKIEDFREACTQYGFSHLPVVEKGIYRGMLRCEDLIDLDEEVKVIKDVSYLLEKTYLSDRMDWTEALAIFMTNEANAMGVLNLAGTFVGIKLLDDVLNLINEKAFVHNQGYVLVVRKLTVDFSVSQVAQIIESGNGIVLGLLVNEMQQTTEVEVKIKTDDINDIIQTFRRYDFEIMTHFEEDMHLKELKEHSDFLRKYLEMGN